MKILFIILLLIIPLHAFADLTIDIEASKIDVTDLKAKVFSHEKILLGMSCKSGYIGSEENLGVISMGDTIEVLDKKITVNIIQAHKYTKDWSPFGINEAKKDEIICTIAENKEALPYENDCNAFWLTIRNCQVLE